MIYLATPYTHPDPAMQQRRFELVTAAAAFLCEQGHAVYSPITHGHPIGDAASEEIHLDVWKVCERLIMPVCSQLAVLLTWGWEESKGVNREMKLATENDKPIIGLVPVQEDGRQIFRFVAMEDV
jgi:hypothetical protein